MCTSISTHIGWVMNVTWSCPSLLLFWNSTTKVWNNALFQWTNYILLICNLLASQSTTHTYPIPFLLRINTSHYFFHLSTRVKYMHWENNACDSEFIQHFVHETDWLSNEKMQEVQMNTAKWHINITRTYIKLYFWFR